MFTEDFAHGTGWFLTGQAEYIDSLIFVVFAQRDSVCRRWSWFSDWFWLWRFRGCLLFLRNLSRIHFNEILNQQISRERINAMSVNHYFVAACRALELSSTQPNNTPSSVVTLFCTFTAEVVLTWEDYHWLCKNVQAHWAGKQPLNVFWETILLHQASRRVLSLPDFDKKDF